MNEPGFCLINAIIFLQAGTALISILYMTGITKCLKRVNIIIYIKANRRNNGTVVKIRTVNAYVDSCSLFEI